MENNNFEYKVSVIVPVYNVENYVAQCLDSLVRQTIDKNEMEVLAINDGSTDSSLLICQQYAEIFPFIKVFSKENEGLSATRNFGIKRARGKYLMYLDSDDTLTEETIKSVTDFFDLHYDEVDLVTYLDQPYRLGKKMKVHYRYQYLKESAIYNLDEYPYISQTRVNICVKNLGNNNYLFDTSPAFRLEDQEYCSKVFRDKLKVGFCNKGEYQYNRSNEGSIVSNYFHAYYIFESSMIYFEKLFSSFGETIPRYYQEMFFNDLQWKHNENKLYPYHYSDDEFKKAMSRIKALLEKVDSDIIYNHPQLDNFNKHYWLALKPNAYPTILANQLGVGIYVDEQNIYFRTNFEIIMHKIRVRHNQLRFLAFIKSPIYTYLDEKATLYVEENSNGENLKKIDVFESIFSYYKSNTKTCNFYAFYYECDVSKVRDFKFYVKLDGILYKTVYWCMPVAVFNNKISAYVRENTCLRLRENTIHISIFNENAINDFEEEQNELYSEDPSVYELRKESLIYRKNHHIWLYYDLHTVEKDNGFFQFQNDFQHQDGIERYYVYDRELSEIEDLFSNEQRRFLIRFSSTQHKLLYLCSEKILTAYYGFSTISPFTTEAEEAKYLDIFHAEIIYLQHGVLHADLRLRNHAERCRSDRIVISSPFEKNNYMKNYAYQEDDLICTGMARYDYIDKTKPGRNRILFAPSWREYLTTVKGGSDWKITEKKILTSDYYKKFMDFLTDDKLFSILENANLHLDVKLHPIIADAKYLFPVENERVHFAPSTVTLEDYQIFITDFSSYLFDFVYLSRPIIYFVPDMEQFESGMNHYRKLDLPFDEAFGQLTLAADDAVEEVNRIVNRNFEPESIFKKRMESFFFDFSECAEGLYRFLISE